MPRRAACCAESGRKAPPTANLSRRRENVGDDNNVVGKSALESDHAKQTLPAREPPPYTPPVSRGFVCGGRPRACTARHACRATQRGRAPVFVCAARRPPFRQTRASRHG